MIARACVFVLMAAVLLPPDAGEASGEERRQHFRPGALLRCVCVCVRVCLCDCIGDCAAA